MKGTRKRARIGDVLEIATPAGLAYFQYTHQNAMMGWLIRVLPGLFEKRPEDFAELARGRERYFIFFPVTTAANRGLVTIVAHEGIPSHAQPFPSFRAGTVGNWWLWDGEREWRIGSVLAPDQRSLPVREAWNVKMLASRIASGWSPEDETIEPS